MENNDTDTDYHKFVRLGDQKWEIVEITITIFYTGSFQVPSKKNHRHLKCQFPWNIPIWPKPFLYKCSEKSLSPKFGTDETKEKSQRTSLSWY